MVTDSVRPGDLVHDRDDPDPTDGIVVNLPQKPASEWEIYALDCTLAEDNPNYPADASTVVVVYVDELLDYWPSFDPKERNQLSMTDLNGSSVHYYSFPAPRLAVLESPASEYVNLDPTGEAESISDSTGNSAPTPPTKNTEDETSVPTRAVERLAAVLADRGLSPEIEADGETLRISKLGQTYRLQPGTIIEGDGAFRSRLESIVRETSGY